MKYFFSLGVVLLLLFSVGGNAQQTDLAAELDNIKAIEIRTKTIKSVNISFLGPREKGKIKGLIMAPSPLNRARKLELQIIDPSGSVIETDLIKGKDFWGRVFRHYEFELPISESGIARGSVLRASVLSGSTILAFGERDLPVVSRDPSYSIKDLNVFETDGKGVLDFAFRNNELRAVRITPKLMIKHLNLDEEGRESFLEERLIPPKSEKVLSYNFDLPLDPGVYEVSITPIGSSKRSLAGTISNDLVIDGGFGSISEVDLQTFKEGDSYNYNFITKGVYSGDYSNLSLNFSAEQTSKNFTKSVKQSVSFSGEKDGFTAVIPLRLSNENTSLIGEVELLGDSKILAKKKFDFSIEYADSLVRAEPQSGFVGEVMKTNSKWKLLVMFLVFIVLIILIGWLFFRAYKSKKSKPLLMIIIGFTLWSSTAKAESLQNLWYHPLPGWTYNPSATDQFSNFKLVRFHGTIFNSLTQRGFFQSNPSRIVVKFYRDSGDQLYVESFDYDILDKKTYKFNLSMSPVLQEGQWEVQIYLLLDGTWYVTTWKDEGTGDPNYVTVDKTPPVASQVTFDNVSYLPANKLVWIELSLLEVGRQVVSIARKQKRNDRKQGVLGASGKRVVRYNKIKIRNHKVNLLREKELARNNLPPNTSTTAVDEEITTLVDELDGLAIAINDITNDLGEEIPFEEGVASTANLENNNNITPIITTTPQGVAGSYSCPIATGGTDFDSTNLSGCLDVINSEISGLTTQFISKSNEIRTTAGRFKKTSIGVELVCDDALSGCYSACNPADEICDINCVENPQACELYETDNFAGYSANCSGSPEICEVDCVLDPQVCRRGTLSFGVRGNFCSDSEYCDDTAPKDFQVCDNVGNCTVLTDSGVETDWYDPVEPNLTASNIIRNKGNIGGTETVIDGQGVDSLAAANRFTFDITAEDPKNPTVAEFPALFDTNACGSSASDDFFHSNPTDTYCSQSNVSCALSSNIRGSLNQRVGGSCSGQCPLDYLLDVDGFCVPQCDFRLFDGCFPFLLIGETCETSIWLPLDSTMPVGQPFVQTSNCGATRNAIGTKPLTESIKHFLDGEDVFGVFFYDTFKDDQNFSKIIYAPSFDINTGGFGGMTSAASVNATFSHESGFSPAGGNVLKIEAENMNGGFAAWESTGVAVQPNTEYILSYWVKTNASINKNSQGAWIRLIGNGSSTDIFDQYVASMDGASSDLSWVKIDIPFTTPSGTTNVDLQLRLQAQNNRVVYFDDIRIFEKNWRYDASKSWYTETLDDVGGTCDYMTGDGDGDPRGGADDRCGDQSFPEKVVVAFTGNGMYIFDVIKGTLWMSALQDPDPLNWGRQIFNSLLFGDSYGLNGKIYSTFRFDQGGGKNGAVIVADLIGDSIYSHRMNSCFTLAGHKGSGSSYNTYYPSGCGQYAYNWNNFINDTTSTRNVPAYPWTTVMPSNLQIATNQVNSMHTQVVAGKTYIAIATNFGVTVLNKTDNTNQHIEFDGIDSSNYVWSYTPSNANIHRKVYITQDGKLYYLWDYNADSRTRVWVINDITSLPFNSSILSGNDVWDYAVQPNNSSSSYPVTALPDTADALDVNFSSGEFLIGSDSGAERFSGTFTMGTEHANLYRMRIMRLFAGAPLYGKIIGHWANGLQDVGGMANDLTTSGAVTVSSVAIGADLQQINFTENGHLSSSDNDFDILGDLTIGVWVKTSSGVDDGGYILAKSNDSNVDFALYRDSDDRLRVDGTTSTTPNFALDGWNFVVVTWDGTNKKTYIDGQLVSLVADTKTNFSSVGAIRMGDYSGTSSASTKLNGSIALPFVVGNTYNAQQIRNIYNGTRDWFDEEVKITLQGVSDDVRDVAYGDSSGSYFVATASGITHFDLGGRVVRTINTGVTSETNVQIASNDIHSINYQNGWLTIAYNGRGIEIVNITRDGKELAPQFDASIYDPYYFY